MDKRSVLPNIDYVHLCLFMSLAFGLRLTLGLRSSVHILFAYCPFALRTPFDLFLYFRVLSFGFVYFGFWATSFYPAVIAYFTGCHCFPPFNLHLLHHIGTLTFRFFLPFVCLIGHKRG